MAQQDQNSLGGLMAAQGELSSINAARVQNSQAEQAFLQQQQAANAVMMQAAQIGTGGGLGQQVGAMNPQTQALLAQYGINGVPTQPGKTTSTSKTTQSGGSVKIENNTITNNDIKIVNPPGQSGGDGGNQAKFQTWLSNSFAKQDQEYEVQRRAFARRDRDLEKQSNKMMRELEKSTNTLGEKLNPKTWAAANGDQTKKVLGLLLLTLAPKLIQPISERLKKLTGIFEDEDGKGFFSKIKEALGIDEKTKPIEAIKKALTDGFGGVKTWFGLLFEERSRAIESIKKPGEGGGTSVPGFGGIQNWLTYLSNVLTAFIGGYKGLSKANANQMRGDSQDKFTGSDHEIASTMQRDAKLVLDSNTSDSRKISTDYYDLTGRLKGGNSLGSIAVTKGISAEINIIGGGPKDSSIVAKRMSDLEGLVEREGSYLMGERRDALDFLEVWGLNEDYLNLLVKENLVKTIVYRLLTWKGENHRIESGLFDPNESLPDFVNTKNSIIDEKRTFYIMTKEGFDRIKKDVFGDEKLKFKDSTNDSIIHSKLTSLHKDKEFKNEDRYQQLNTTNSISDAYQTARSNVNYGAAENVAKVISDQAKITGNKVMGFVSDGWKLIKGVTLKGAYLNTDEERKNFIEDLYGVFSKELFTYYKGKGLSDEDAIKRASMMASILTSQCALESGYGTNSNSRYFNYANLTGGKKTRKGKDKNKIGEEIEQDFRIFESGEEFARAFINLLDTGKQYEGALFASSAEDYFKLIQRGYDGIYNPYKIGPDKGKFAEDLEYVSKGVSTTKEILPKIEEYINSLESSEVENSSIKFDGSVPHVITPDKQYKAEFDRLRIGNLKEGETPWDAITGLYEYNSKTGLYDIPIDKNMFDISDPNSIKETINRAASSNQYPELHSLMFDSIGPDSGILFHIQKRKNFSDLAQRKLAETEKLLGSSSNKDQYHNVPFFLIPTKDGKQFRIHTISVRTMNASKTTGPMYTGFVFEQPNGEFPDEYYKIPKATKKGLPAGRNPQFYSINFDLDSEGRLALRRWQGILSSGFYINERGSLVYKDSTDHEKYLSKLETEGLEKLGLISNVKDVWLGIGNHAFQAELTDEGKKYQERISKDERYNRGWINDQYKYLSGENWEIMSDDEKSKYIDYLSSLTTDPEKKTQLKLLKATSDASLIEAQRIVGVIAPNSQIKPALPKTINPEKKDPETQASSPQESPSMFLGNDYGNKTYDNRTFNLYGTWSDGANSNVYE